MDLVRCVYTFSDRNTIFIKPNKAKISCVIHTNSLLCKLWAFRDNKHKMNWPYIPPMPIAIIWRKN